MPTYTMSYRGSGGGGWVELNFSAPNDRAALRTALVRGARKAKATGATDEEKAARFEQFFVDGRINLVNNSTQQQYIREFLGNRKTWQTEEGYERRLRRERLVRDTIKQRGFFTDRKTGLILPSEPLLPRNFTQSDGSSVPGSSGTAHILSVDNAKKVAIVSDTGHLRRFWPAIFNPEKNSWVAQGDGQQMEDGKVIERFPLRVGKPLKVEDLALSDIRNVTRYIRAINDSRRAAQRRNRVEAAQKQQEAQAILGRIPGGLQTVNRVDDALESKRQLRVRPEKREAFKRAEKAIAELQRPQPVSLSQAQERFDSLSDRRKALDGARTAQNIAPAKADTDKERRLQQRWLKNPSRLDFQGVDTKRAKPPLKPRMRRSKKL